MAPVSLSSTGTLFFWVLAGLLLWLVYSLLRVRRSKPSFSINDSSYFNVIWSPHQNGASKELGKAEDAIRTLNETLGGLNDSRWHTDTHNLLYERISELIECVTTYLPYPLDNIIGDPEDVHHIIPPQHIVGYALYKSKDGTITREVIEGLREKVEVLRRNGRIIAVESKSILRHEQYGNMHVI